MSSEGPSCEECGVPANVHITDLEDGLPTVRHLCRDCADAVDSDRAAPRSGPAIAAVLITVGFYILLVSTLADYLAFGSSAGFGWLQRIGLVIAGILLLLGAIAKAPTLLVIGSLTGGLDLLADWLAFGSSDGFGWQQTAGTGLGLAMFAAGVAVARMSR